ncbi:histidine phosphatase superfamily [Aspergillus stella-maris]|uniref:histidine phosphatase superfamily n=1 Tax=Aspergillus stella-maris TaxID=1810926 RepID=UPI003CCD2F31
MALGLAGLTATASAETILGVTVYTRNGDRTSKHYPNYDLTNLGYAQNQQVGSDYRARYIASNAPKQILGISEDELVQSQVYAMAPAEQTLMKTANAILQGLYPPLDTNETETLNNGSSYDAPMGGAQFSIVNSVEANTPEAVWLSGDESCPAMTDIAYSFKMNGAYETKLRETRDFYRSFADVLENVTEYNGNTPALSYEKAYDIFDLINVGLIHNESLRDAVSSDDLFQLRTLADSQQFGLNFDPSFPYGAIGARTLSWKIVAHLNETIASRGATKFSLLAGSYENMLGFFGLQDLTSVSEDFYGIPDYASTMAFELFTDNNVTSFPVEEEIDSLRVRFLFRNGSDSSTRLTPYPLFGRNETSLTWDNFRFEMRQTTVESPEAWCNDCNNNSDMCAALRRSSNPDHPISHYSPERMSNAVAGVIGAMVTLGVIAAVAALAAFMIMRRRWKRTAPVGIPLAVGADIRRKDSQRSLGSHYSWVSRAPSVRSN